MPGHNYGAVYEGRQYQTRGQWLSSGIPSLAAPSSAFWGLEVWSGGSATQPYQGSRLAAVHRNAGSGSQDVYGDWSAAAGGWLYAYKSLAFPPDGWP